MRVVMCCLALAGCANTGIVPMDAGTYGIGIRSPQVGFGPAVGAKADAYQQANAFCAERGMAVETVKLETTDSGFARSAAAELQFRCVPK